jgi:maltose phosphorylase
MATKDQQVARNLLTYRYNQLDKAIENTKQSRFQKKWLFTGDYSYIPERTRSLIGIARFWHQRANFSKNKNQYVILGVTGPNEYENNVNSIPTLLQNGVLIIRTHNFRKFRWNFRLTTNVLLKNKLADSELKEWKKVADNMYFPVSKDLGIYLQQDGF